METEVKLAFKNKDSLFKVAKTDSFLKACDNADVSPVFLENSYLDTNDMTLLRRGGAARIRHVSGNDAEFYELTVKYGGGADNGLHKRYEWNVKTSENKFSIKEFINNVPSEGDPVEYLNEVFENIEDDNLRVICSNSFYRTLYKLEYGNSVIEACFDSGLIKSSDGSKTDEICELELELVTGDVNDLNALRDLITGENDCVPLDKSKYMRTLAMVNGDM